MKQILEQCSELVLKGIMPSLLIAGRNLIRELNQTAWAGNPHAHELSSIQIDKLNTEFGELEVIHVSADDFCEVYGKSLITE